MRRRSTSDRARVGLRLVDHRLVGDRLVRERFVVVLAVEDGHACCPLGGLGTRCLPDEPRRAGAAGASLTAGPPRNASRPVIRDEPNVAERDNSDTIGWVNRNTTTRSRIVDRPSVNAKPFTSPAAK